MFYIKDGKITAKSILEWLIYKGALIQSFYSTFSVGLVHFWCIFKITLPNNALVSKTHISTNYPPLISAILKKHN